MKGNDEGLQRSEAFIATWLAQRDIDPESVEIEYIYTNGGNPVFGISRVIWEDHGARNKATVGKRIAHFSARWGGLRASGATLSRCNACS